VSWRALTCFHEHSKTRLDWGVRAVYHILQVWIGTTVDLPSQENCIERHVRGIRPFLDKLTDCRLLKENSAVDKFVLSFRNAIPFMKERHESALTLSECADAPGCRNNERLRRRDIK
jgi:hypothetical protein